MLEKKAESFAVEDAAVGGGVGTGSEFVGWVEPGEVVLFICSISCNRACRYQYKEGFSLALKRCIIDPPCEQHRQNHPRLRNHLGKACCTKLQYRINNRKVKFVGWRDAGIRTGPTAVAAVAAVAVVVVVVVAVVA